MGSPLIPLLAGFLLGAVLGLAAGFILGRSSDDVRAHPERCGRE